MKKTISGSCLAALVIAAGLFTATLPAAGQSILIEINQANVSAVQFVATVNGSIVSDSSQFNLFGVDLINYFTTAPAVGRLAPPAPSLPPGQASPMTNQSPII